MLYCIRCIVRIVFCVVCLHCILWSVLYGMILWFTVLPQRSPSASWRPQRAHHHHHRSGGALHYAVVEVPCIMPRLEHLFVPPWRSRSLHHPAEAHYHPHPRGALQHRAVTADIFIVLQGSFCSRLACYTRGTLHCAW